MIGTQYVLICQFRCPDPLKLGCGHTVCDRTCLRRDDVYQFDVFCPVCEAKFDYIEAVLPISYASEEEKYLRDPECVGCGRSSKMLSECFHCDKELCNTCVKSHLEIVSFIISCTHLSPGYLVLT